MWASTISPSEWPVPQCYLLGKSGQTVMELGGYDVVITPQTTILTDQFVGNTRFCVLLYNQLIPNPRALESRASREALARSVVGALRTNGGRFLENRGEVMVELDDASAREWVQRFIQTHVPGPSMVFKFYEEHVQEASPQEHVIEDPRMRAVISDTLQHFTNMLQEVEEKEESDELEHEGIESVASRVPPSVPPSSSTATPSHSAPSSPMASSLSPSASSETAAAKPRT